MISREGALAWRLFRRARSLYHWSEGINEPMGPLLYRPPRSAPSRLLLLAKSSLLYSFLGYYGEWLFAKGIGVLVHPQGVTPSRGYCEEVGRLARNFRLSVLFVGDLDPLDLTNFAILATGDPDLESLSVRQMPVEYLGIDDRWLSLCESQLRRGYRKKGKTPFIAMEKGERKHFSVVKKIFPDLEELIGPKCVQLLEEGRKLEVEGAANPSFYRKEFPERLRAFLAKAPPYSP